MRVILDTNVLILYCVGTINRSGIRTHRRINRYSDVHFEKLTKLLGYYQKLVITPHILAETSNLIRTAKSGMLDMYDHGISVLANGGLFTEIPQPLKSIASEATIFSQFGATDAGVCNLLSTTIDTHLITDDEPLRAIASSIAPDRVILFSDVF